ncbi:hypothetical protein OJ998_33235 [Solirubrobacter taibaiensis]|nr:hypothetical protein [Solirubrobacter taibaiensis]
MPAARSLDGLDTTTYEGAAGLIFGAADHGGQGGHLPPTQHNVELVSKLEVNTPNFAPGALPSQIADLTVHKNTAYLNSWAERGDAAACARTGFFAVDISDPSKPRQIAYRASMPSNRYGEGAHAITFPDGRDILAVNNEFCTTNGTPPETGGGGFALYDVTDPSNPTKLVDAAGDYGPPGELVCCDADAPGAEDETAHQYHSVFMWRDDGRVYLIGVDNDEQAQTDIDIFDITDPSAPKAVREYDLDAEFPVRDGEEDGLGDNVFSHDMVVKEIDGVQTLLAAYWDGGYVLANIEDPADATYIGDTRFDNTDPLTKFTPPEGNAHQAEFSHDNEYVLAADEDFDAFRFLGRVNPAAASPFDFRQVGVTVTSAGSPTGPQVGVERALTGDTRYVGNACTAASIAPATPGVTIAIVNPLGCAFRAKTNNAEARGYQGVIIFAASNAETSNASFLCDAITNLSGYDDYAGNAVTLWVTRETGFEMMGLGDGFRCGSTNPTPTPTAPIEGVPVDIGAKFDGWGYAHLYRAGSGKLNEVGTPYAIPEGISEQYATDYGDVSIHEFAADPDVNLAYASYYSGGLRVVSFGDAGIQETGRYIDAAGSNIWGVEQFTSGGQRLIAASDRDFGLYIFRYTGPVPPPKPQAGTPPAATPPGGTPVGARPDRTDPLISLLSNRRQSLRTLRTTGLRFRVRVNETARVEVGLRGRFTSTLKRGARGKVQVLKQNGAVRVAAGQTVTVTVRPSAALRRKLAKERRLPGLLSVKAVDAAGNDATRTKVLTFR